MKGGQEEYKKGKIKRKVRKVRNVRNVSKKGKKQKVSSSSEGRLGFIILYYTMRSPGSHLFVQVNQTLIRN